MVRHDLKDTMEYAVEQIVRHTGKNGKQRHFLCWYGYTPIDDSDEPSEHLSSHFVT